jgi:hypothetical protein
MRWRRPWQSDDEIKAAAFRRVHERWLSQAMRRPESVPRIPVRRVADGGFARMMARPAGRRAIERWWRRVLSSPALDLWRD